MARETRIIRREIEKWAIHHWNILSADLVLLNELAAFAFK